MNEEIQNILSGIESDDPEAFNGASELLRAHVFGVDGTSVLEPYASIYSENPLDDDDVNSIKRALLLYLADGNLPNAPSAAHALMQLGDRDCISKLQKILDERLRSFSLQGYTVGQLLLALDRCGENATSGTSYSHNEFDKNAEDARRYLRSHGFEESW